MTKEERDNAICCIKKWSEKEPYLQTYKTCIEALEQAPLADKRYTLTIVFSLDKSCALMVMHNKQHMYNFVGGHIEPGEDEMDASYRELYEETGITKDDIDLKFVQTEHCIASFANPEWYLYISTGILKHDVDLKKEKNDLHWVAVVDTSKLSRESFGDGNCEVFLRRATRALGLLKTHDASDSTKEEPHLDDWADYLHKLSDGEMSCDRNICVSNEYNGIGCNECICNTGNRTCQREDIEEVIPVQDPPCEEKVSVGVLKQVMWERDVAIKQLNELGYGLGQKMWIDVNDFLPEERENPITMDFYEYPVTYRNGDVCDIRYYKFGKGHWWHGPEIMDKYVKAWLMIPEPYRECEKLTKEEIEDLLCVGGLTAELEVKEI